MISDYIIEGKLNRDFYYILYTFVVTITIFFEYKIASKWTAALKTVWNALANHLLE